MNFDGQISEESQFNYAKLSYELSLQSVAIEGFRKFAQAYPNSDHIAEVNEMLVDVYLTTKNYKDALTAIENISNKSQNVKTAYQKVAFFRGVELFMDNKPKKPLSCLTRP